MNWIVITAIVLSTIILLFYLSVRIFYTFNLRFNNEMVQQKPEIVSNKFIIFQSGDKVPFKFIKKANNKTLVLCVTDLYGNLNDFDNLINMNPSYDFFVLGRRNQVDNYQYKTIACDREDILAINTILQNKYPHKKIILLLEGFACGWWFWFAKDKNHHFAKIMLLNPITHKNKLRLNWKIQAKLPFYFLFSWKHRVSFKLKNEILFAPNKKEITTKTSFDRKKTSFDYLIVWFQYFWLNRHFYRKLQKYCFRHHELKIVWYQSDQSLFFNQKLKAKLQDKHLPYSCVIINSKFQFNIFFPF